MLRFLFLRFILPLILFLIVRSVLKSVWGAMHSQMAPRQSGRPSPSGNGAELVKDPVCGTYVAVSTSVTKVVDGKPVHFCSQACRDKFRAA